MIVTAFWDPLHPFPITASFLHPEMTHVLTFSIIISVLFFIVSPLGQVIIYICL